MNLRHVLAAAATTAIFVAASAPAAGPGTAPAPRSRLELTRPMLADGKRLEPGVYDVVFESSPAGPPHFVAVFLRGGARVATVPAELKGAPAAFKVLEITANDWLRSSLEQNYSRKDGSIHPAKFEFKARTERAFFEALLTEIGIPAVDGESKAPAVTTRVPLKFTPAKK